MVKSFYITTPIYYPTAKPHIGSAYTTLAADILKRWHSLLGEDVFFLTGTDEHGKKLEQAAEKAGKKPKTFIDSLIPEFKDSWKKLNINYDRFIRTTDSDHEQVVQVILSEAHKKGDIYESYYEGLYCTDCETYYTEKDLENNNCPIHKKPVEKLKEESYFFKLSKYQKKLLDYYKKNPDAIQPAFRKEEIINRIKAGLSDISISRTSFSWGIPLPFDKKHVTYVWFDALTNYLTGIGYLENKKQFKKYWPGTHLVGKDILWFHAVIWPAMLFSVGLEPAKQVFAHGFLTIHGNKIGKSAGNASDLNSLTNLAGPDALRYFLFRSIPFGEDAEFSVDSLVERYNNELANKLGNLVSRVSALAEIHGLEKTKTLQSKDLVKKVTQLIDTYQFDKALNEIFAFIDSLNELMQSSKPWETKDKKILYQVADGIKTATILLSPFIPESADKISHIFKFELNIESIKEPLKITKIKKPEVLFKKIEMAKETNLKVSKVDNPKAIAKSEKSKGKELAPEIVSEKDNQNISYDYFSKVKLKIGKILSVKPHPNADKLYVLEVSLGENDKRTIVAGLRNHYTPEKLKGKKAVFVSNLQPVELRGIKSEGMILAAVNDDDSNVTILLPDEDIPEGSKIR